MSGSRFPRNTLSMAQEYNRIAEEFAKTAEYSLPFYGSLYSMSQDVSRFRELANQLNRFASSIQLEMDTAD